MMGSALMTALQPASIRARTWASLKVILESDDEYDLVRGAALEAEAPIGACFFGFGEAARNCDEIGQMEMQKPRAASVWLRIVECERVYWMSCESGG